jgi:hypothetical protein
LVHRASDQLADQVVSKAVFKLQETATQMELVTLGFSNREQRLQSWTISNAKKPNGWTVKLLCRSSTKYLAVGCR